MDASVDIDSVDEDLGSEGSYDCGCYSTPSVEGAHGGVSLDENCFR